VKIPLPAINIDVASHNFRNGRAVGALQRHRCPRKVLAIDELAQGQYKKTEKYADNGIRQIIERHTFPKRFSKQFAL